MNQMQTEIVVVGAGMAGCAAAIAAARAGKKVVLIDNHPYLGGAATSAEVGTICGLYATSKTTESVFLVNGFALEFATEFIKAYNLKPLVNHFGLHYLPYNVNDLKVFLQHYVKKNGVELSLCSTLIDVQFKEDVLVKAEISKGNHSFFITFDALIDCSGNAAVAQILKHPLVPTAYNQLASIVFHVSKSKLDASESSNFKLIRTLKSLEMNGILPDGNSQLFVIPGSFSEDVIGFKLTLPWQMDASSMDVLSLRNRAHAYVKTYFEILKVNTIIFENATLSSIAEDVGWRTSVRPLGQYVLNESDVVFGHKFEDAIAKSEWPIEEWLPSKGVQLEFVKQNTYYEIPSLCLKSSVYCNYFFAGRMISASDRAIASARVMGVCLQTGFAAGELASAINVK